ncbi:MAG: transporter [Bacteroidales bacterium]|nr:transporter [Bacteroidales bacterium]
MDISRLRQNLKPWMLPIAMLCGILFHSVIDSVQFLAPWLIFTMLLITFCRLRPSEFRITPLTWLIVAVQIFGGIALYFALSPLSTDIAEGAMICVLCPTATAAPVITGMLGGSIAVLVAISLLSNLGVALVAPPFFAMIGGQTGMHISYAEAFLTIAAKVGPLILGPIAVALLLLRFAPRVHDAISSRQSLSFYIWAVSLIIVVGRAVTFAMAEPAERVPEMVLLALIAGAVCIAQFIIGRRIGRRYGDRIAGAQGLGQKNTVLAVWMAVTYLNPIASIAPAAYIAWQNTINSVQIYYKERRSAQSKNQACR